MNSEITNSSDIETNTDYNNESVINNSQSDPYLMLHNEDDNNPFFKCNITQLDYDTSSEDNAEDTNYVRIILNWNYQINYDWFQIKKICFFFKKDECFFNNLNELKEIRNNFNQGNPITGKIYKLDDHLEAGKDFYTYLIIYYDNAKINIELYGIFNQLIDEKKLIENIKSENIYGQNGTLDQNASNLNNHDFIVKYVKNVKF